ncbi:MAG TPA: PAS domain S-box protein [Fimbriimonas sp.]|nr:PAS domain S-box protein [Fimbriimonas sp.]
MKSEVPVDSPDGTVSSPNSIRPRLSSPNHFVQFYNDEAFLAKSVGRFMAEGLLAGEGALVVATPSHGAAIEAEIEELGIDLDSAKANGGYHLLDAEQSLARFMVNGTPDESLFREAIGPYIDRALSGRSGIRAFGEMVALLCDAGNSEGAIQLEAIGNNIADELAICIFCAYPFDCFREDSGAETFAKICEKHGRVIPAEAFASVDTAFDQLRIIGQLQQKASSLEVEVAKRQKVEEELRENSRTLETLYRIAGELVVERDLHRIVQTVTDAGRELSGAAFGAFFYNVINETGEAYMLYTLSGAPREAFEKFPMPRNSEIFAPTFDGSGVVRLHDVTKDPRYGKMAPYHGMPPGHLPVRSYLAVPVISNSGEVLGGLFYGHPTPGVFSEKAEQVLVALAAHAAVAVDNYNLHRALELELVTSKQNEKASQHFAAIVEYSQDAIVSKDLNGVIMSWNKGAEKIFGYTADEVIGKSVTILIPEDHLDEEPAILSRIRRGESIEHYETVRRRKDGSLIDISLTVSPIRDLRGNLFGASKIVRDISIRKQNERALQEAREKLQKANEDLEHRVEERTASLRAAVEQMEEFSYTVSHDLRAPLRTMNMYSHILLEDFDAMLAENPEARNYLQRIADSASRLDRMVLDLLTYGRVARDKLKMQRVSLDKLARDLLENDLGISGEAVNVQVDPLLDVVGHEPSVTQILSNLIANAVKFSKKDVPPKVHVWTERKGDRVRLWVEDNGIGIEPRHQHRLFKMFERIHPNLSYEGTGVGLAIVRKATERMRGSVGVESDGESGSKFWIDLPAPKEGE